MMINNRRLDSLIPYDHNPRINDQTVPLLVNSIKQFGFKVPLVIDRDNVIVAGHTRYKAALELGMEEVPCIIADDLSPEQVKAFRLADNKVAEASKWDFGLLQQELDQLSMEDLDFDMSDFGFEMQDLPSEDEFGEDFTLPEGDQGEIRTMSLTLHVKQIELIKKCMNECGEPQETFGNSNDNGNKVYEVVRQWAELKRL
jgi:ParB-like chromosome segregation protein Spo0J